MMWAPRHVTTGRDETRAAPQKVRPGFTRLAAAATLLLVACGGRSAAPVDGTRRMADTLQSLYAAAVANPGGYEFLNRERADALFAGVQESGGRDRRDVFALARELLLAGRTEDAIAVLRRLVSSSGMLLTRRHPEFKPVYDLLGIAYLRLGEQQNCNLNPNTSVCIIGQLHHEQREGARNAKALYETMLREFPDDMTSRWLLNVAAMAAGEYPRGLTRTQLIPNITLRHAPAFPTFFNVADDVGAAINGLAGGLCVADYDNDGFADIFATSWGMNDPIHLLLNDKHGAFTDRSASAGLAGIVGGPNCRHADYDNDGDEDIFVVRGGWLGDGGRFPNSLLRNRGDGTFEDVTFAAGLFSLHPSHTAAWADFNLDGWLDLAVGNESGVGKGWSSHPSELFVSNRDGTFTEVSRRVGVDLDAFVKGLTWGDVNNDGLPDLFVSVFGGANRLYVNRGGHGADWHFEEVAAQAGVQRPYLSFPTWFFDYDNDGWDDLLVLSYDNRTPLPAAVAREYLGLPPESAADDPSQSPDHSYLYHNRHDGTFEDVSAATGLASKAIFAMGSNFGDIDNDGWLDFYLGTGNPDLRSIIPNRMFRGINGKAFEEVTLEGGFGHLQKGHGTAFVDFDRDGDEDIYMMLGGAYAGDVFTSVLFENPGWTRNNWVTLELEGRAANRSAIGARVQVVAADATGATRSIWRTVDSGGSFGSGTLQVHVGLGTATRVPLVRVAWPDSLHSRTEYQNLEPGRTYRIVQGEAPRLLDRPAVPFRHGAGAPMKMGAARAIAHR